MSIKANIRLRIAKSQNNKCCYCNREMAEVPNKTDIKQIMGQKPSKSYRRWQQNPLRPTLEHVIPKCSGGKNSISNYMVSCKCCNTMKGDMPHESYSILVHDEISIIIMLIQRQSNRQLKKLKSSINYKFKVLRGSIELAID